MKTSNSRIESALEVRRHLSGTSEVRTYSAALELRDDASDHFVTVRGTPIVYDVPYLVSDAFGSFRERMRRGCVRDLLANGTDTVLAVNHDMRAIPLARTGGGGLELEDSARGLTFQARLDTRQSAAADLAVAIENKVIRQMSIGMVVGRDSWNPEQTERDVHALKALFDISGVTFPASPTTSITVARSATRRITSAERRAELDRIEQRRHGGRGMSHAELGAQMNERKLQKARTDALLARLGGVR